MHRWQLMCLGVTGHASKEAVVQYYLTRQVLRAPELARIALIANAPDPTEACVERSFSHQELLSNAIRCSLSQEFVKP